MTRNDVEVGLDGRGDVVARYEDESRIRIGLWLLEDEGLSLEDLMKRVEEV